MTCIWLHFAPFALCHAGSVGNPTTTANCVGANSILRRHPFVFALPFTFSDESNNVRDLPCDTSGTCKHAGAKLIVYLPHASTSGDDVLDLLIYPLHHHSSHQTESSTRMTLHALKVPIFKQLNGYLLSTSACVSWAMTKGARNRYSDGVSSQRST